MHSRRMVPILLHSLHCLSKQVRLAWAVLAAALYLLWAIRYSTIIGRKGGGCYPNTSMATGLDEWKTSGRAHDITGHTRMSGSSNENQYAQHSSPGYNHSIPRIIHHIWFNTYTTELVKAEPTGLQTSCLDINCVGFPGGWSYMHWDETNIKTLATWPLIKHLWDKTEETNPRKLSDIARLAILWEYGGAYLDSDVACFKPFDMLLESPSLSGATLVGGQENNGPNSKGFMINGIVFAAQRHPFIEWMLVAFQRRVITGSDWMTTGPLAWGQELKAFSEAHPKLASRIKILPSAVLCPLQIDGSAPSDFTTDTVWTINFYPSTNLFFPDRQDYESLKAGATLPRCQDLSSERRVEDVLTTQERSFVMRNRPQEDMLVPKEDLRSTPW